MLAGRLVLPGHGFTAAHGFPPLSLGNGPDLRAAVGSVLYLALIALLALGVATAVREAAVAIGLVLGLLYLFPILSSVVGNQHWQRHLEQIGPMNAGLYVQATIGLKVLPLTPSPSSPPGRSARCCSAPWCCACATPYHRVVCLVLPEG